MTNVSIIVLDFGSQYTQLIARRLREDKIYCEILPYHTKVQDIAAKNPKGIILSGGPSSVYSKDAYEVDQGVYSMGIPVLGICYGMQRIAVDFGGSVIRSDHHEYGKAEMDLAQWMLVTLTAGVGGSLISFGSAAGVGVMGRLKGIYTFGSHLKLAWTILIGYIVSVCVWYVQFEVLGLYIQH